MIDALEAIESFIKQRTPKQICLSNAYTVALSQSDTEFRTLLNRSDLTLADGMSIVWGGKWIGPTVPERIAGPDLMEALCRLAAKKGHRIFLLGASPSTLRLLREKLLRLCPTLSIADLYSPPMCDTLSDDETQKILGLICQAKPDILFVGMSCPKQEKWIAKNLHQLSVPVSLGVGAAFDFLSGNIPRAPRWLRQIGLEWLYRLYREPRRLWKRYLLGNSIFLFDISREIASRKLRTLRSPSE